MKPGETQLPTVANDDAWRVDRRYRYAWWPGDDSDLVVSYETRLARARREAALMGWRLERKQGPQPIRPWAWALQDRGRHQRRLCGRRGAVPVSPVAQGRGGFAIGSPPSTAADGRATLGSLKASTIRLASRSTAACSPTPSGSSARNSAALAFHVGDCMQRCDSAITA
jgi:hypothetical protein